MKNKEHEIAVSLIKTIGKYKNNDVDSVLSAMAIVLSAVALEAGYCEEKAVISFRQSFKSAEQISKISEETLQ